MRVQTSRRGLLGGLAVAVVAAPAFATGDTDGPQFLEWERQHDGWMDRCNNTPGDERFTDWCLDHAGELERLILETPARSRAAWGVKVRRMATNAREFRDDYYAEPLAQLASMLEAH